MAIINCGFNALSVFHYLGLKTCRTGSALLVMGSPLAEATAVPAVSVALHPDNALSMLKSHPFKTPGYRAEWTGHLQNISIKWAETAPANEFLQLSYLTALEENAPSGMRFSYVIFYKNDLPIGVAYCQISPFNVDTSIQSEQKNTFPCMVQAFGRFLKNLVVGKNHNLLVCGNLLLTGEHGFHFSEETGSAMGFQLLEEALQMLQTYWENQKVHIDGIFIKDVSQQKHPNGRWLVERKFREFTFHPNMVLHVQPEWKSFDDYLAAISSKYRVRAKKAFRLCENIEKKELTTEQIISYGPRLFELYKSVMDNQDFNMVTLHENYLPSLRQHLGGRFRVFGYFSEGELVGYYTTILNGSELEAHFLGFEPAFNKAYQMYLNMLFDLLRFGIEQRVHQIVYARTAMEIKSSVGAVPYDMFCYIRASNRLTNKILPPILEYLRPPAAWVQRVPFKDGPE